jgi:hypothetical protein
MNKMRRLYIVRVEWSQTDHDFVGIWAASNTEACKLIEELYPEAYYYSISASTGKIINS